MYFAAQEEKDEVSDMVDLHLLTDDQLKARLIQYGVKPGPIVGQSNYLNLNEGSFLSN